MSGLIKKHIHFSTKVFILLLFVLTASFAISFTNAAEPDTPTNSDEVVTETTVESPTVSGLNYDLIIRSGKGNEFQIFHNSQEESHQNFSILPDDIKEKFLQKRADYLSTVANFLDYSGSTVSYSTYIKSRISFGLTPFGMAKDKITQIVKRWGRKGDLLEEEAIRQFPQLEQLSSIKARRVDIIEGILRSLDAQLWNQAALVARKNEIILATASPNFINERATGTTSGGGGMTGYGITIAYNTDQKAAVFEIYEDVEKFRAALFPFYSIGFVPKIGFGIASTNPYPAEMKRKGLSAYPVGAPGYVTSSSDRLIFGFSTSIATLPPFIGDSFSYANTSEQNVLLRVMISPFLPGFVRVQFGTPSSITARFMSAGQAIREAQTWTRIKQSAKACKEMLSKKFRLQKTKVPEHPTYYDDITFRLNLRHSQSIA